MLEITHLYGGSVKFSDKNSFRTRRLPIFFNIKLLYQLIEGGAADAQFWCRLSDAASALGE